MSFDVTTDERGPVPLLMCFQCNQPIMDLKKGTVMWLPIQVLNEEKFDDLGCTEPVATFLHKGECSRSFDAVHRAVGNYLHCMAIGQFFEAWFQGSQFSSYDRVEARRHLELIRRLGESESDQ